MPQNIERYFGFKVWLDDDLTPQEETALRSVAARLAQIHSIDPERYFVYFHHLRVREQGSHFGFKGGLPERMLWLMLQFDVNKKQRKGSMIRFFNSGIPGQNLPEHEGKNIIPSYSDFSVSFQIPGAYFITTNYFKSAIITFIASDRIRTDLRKIKATVTVMPTLEFAPFIKRSENRVTHTKMDIRFGKDIQLRLPMTRGEPGMTNNKGNDLNTGTHNYYINQAGAVGPSSSASNFTQHFQDDPIASQLRILLAHVAQSGSKPDDIELLRQAASTQDKNEAKHILSKTGSWLLEAGEKIGVPLAVEFIKSSFGS